MCSLDCGRLKAICNYPLNCHETNQLSLNEKITGCCVLAGLSSITLGGFAVYQAFKSRKYKANNYSNKIVLSHNLSDHTLISFSVGDISKERVDVLMNFVNLSFEDKNTNKSLYKAAGTEIFHELKQIESKITSSQFKNIKPGDAVLTSPGHLSNKGVKTIVHAVRFLSENGTVTQEKEALRNSYSNILLLAKGSGNKKFVSHRCDPKQAFKTISLILPPSSFQLSSEEAAWIILDTVADFVELYPEAFSEIRFVFPDPKKYPHDKTLTIFNAAFEREFSLVSNSSDRKSTSENFMTTEITDTSETFSSSSSEIEEDSCSVISSNDDKRVISPDRSPRLQSINF